MKPWLAWAIGVTLLAAAWIITLVTPPDDAAEAPFPVVATIGEEVAARTLDATITQARVADGVTAGGWQAEGTWLVVDLEIAARIDEQGARLGGATLTIDDRTFRASERPPSLFQSPLSVGIPLSGSLAFELPADAADEVAILRLSEDSETRLDALIEVTLDLASLEHVPGADLLPTGWARS